ncbi:Smg-4/UPF3 family-domain-containing protein [Bisporella sp. PMI_857]|nr:Smg-4/UPF3 family-domain-containing protein [Bisporella sp. PMI_857]
MVAINDAPSKGSASSSNGLLPVTASQTASAAPRAAAIKPPSQKLKVIVRRLPPGLTQNEFTAIIGEDWRLGQGKVDWFQYKPGKDSKDLSKPSKPSRAYFHITSQENLISLAEKVAQSTFEDAENTFTNPCLVGPPVVEHALYARIPGLRHRVDQRAGTIDQDPDYQSFLEEMTNPATPKEVIGEAVLGAGALKPEKVTSTPLIEFIRDKKTAKIAAAKAARKQEALLIKAKAAKEASGAGVSDDGRKKGKDVKSDRAVERATKQTIKILNREAAAKAASNSSSKSSDKVSETPSEGASPKTPATKTPTSQRGAATPGQVRMLQRDLGIITGSGRQRREPTTQKGAIANDTGPDTPASPAESKIPTAPKAGATPQGAGRQRKGRGPAIETSKAATASSSTASPQAPMVLLKKPDASQPTLVTPGTPTTPTSQSTQTAPAPPRKIPSVAPSEGATQAFVKHANPSQGVTEELLKQALEAFGAVSMVEIDKRKGFAYANFVEADSLRKAMAANPITVARGTVQVMQRKAEKKPQHQPPAARGGRGGGRGGNVGRRGGRGGMRGGSSSADFPASTPTGPAAK